jgi:transcriptional regulator with XRE-family HTH domain
MAVKTLSSKDRKAKKELAKKFGLALAEARKKAGLTQEQLADKADFHRTYIGFIEQGVYAPNIYTIKKIADALNTKPSELVKYLD